MTFYQAMQLSANVMKPMIKNAENKKEKKQVYMGFHTKKYIMYVILYSFC